VRSRLCRRGPVLRSACATRVAARACVPAAQIARFVMVECSLTLAGYHGARRGQCLLQSTGCGLALPLPPSALRVLQGYDGNAHRQQLELSAKAAPQGSWRWVNEARPGGQPKWGYVSHTPGDRLTLRIARDPDPSAAARSDTLPCIA